MDVVPAPPLWNRAPLWLSTCSQPGHCSHRTRPKMTLFVPLDENQSPPASPSFLVHPDDVPHHLRKALRAILKARRLVVVCGASLSADSARHCSEYRPLLLHCIPGAGISVQAGIPDFRSPTGLFHSLRRDNPKEALTSGKDLFDASVFNVSPFPHRVSHAVCLAKSPPVNARLLSPPHRASSAFHPNYAQIMLTSFIVRAHNLVVLSNDRSVIRAIPGGEPHSVSSATSHP